MKYTIAIRAARLHSGVVLLTEAQAKPRAHNLTSLGKNRYEIIKPVEFKLGEEIGYEGDLPKAMATQLIDTTVVATASKKNEIAQAKAKAEEKPGDTE